MDVEDFGTEISIARLPEAECESTLLWLKVNSCGNLNTAVSVMKPESLKQTTLKDDYGGLPTQQYLNQTHLLHTSAVMKPEKIKHFCNIMHIFCISLSEQQGDTLTVLHHTVASSDLGIELKAAACWFGRHWSILFFREKEDHQNIRDTKLSSSLSVCVCARALYPELQSAEG